MSYSTKQVAAMLGITPQTLRFYERYGIDAGNRGDEGGPRRYTHAGVDELMSIRKYRNCGFTLANAAKALKSAEQNEVAEMFLRQSEALEREIACKQLIVQKLRDVAKEIALCGASPERVHTPALICCPVLDSDRRMNENGPRILSEWSQWMPMTQWTLFISEDFEKQFFGFSIEETSAAICGVEEENGCFHSPTQECIRLPVTWLARKEEVYDKVLPILTKLHGEYGAPTAQIRVQTLLNRTPDEEVVSYGLIFYPIA